MSFTAGSQGGEYNHKLTIQEMPTHHLSAGTVYGWQLSNIGVKSLSIEVSSGYQLLYIDQSNHVSTNILATNDIGGDANYNNTQPYITVYIWHRTR